MCCLVSETTSPCRTAAKASKISNVATIATSYHDAPTTPTTDTKKGKRWEHDQQHANTASAQEEKSKVSFTVDLTTKKKKSVTRRIYERPSSFYNTIAETVISDDRVKGIQLEHPQVSACHYLPPWIRSNLEKSTPACCLDTASAMSSVATISRVPELPPRKYKFNNFDTRCLPSITWRLKIRVPSR